MAVYFNSEINRRSSNEDSYCDLKLRINHEASVHVMSVADGMGGLSGGKYYSRAAVRLLNEKLLHLIMDDDFRGSSLDEQTELLLDFSGRVFQEINLELYTAGLNAGVKGGTTLSMVIHFWHSYIIANCGDSPVYYMKDDELHLASDIQNAAWHMMLEGITQEGSVIYYQNKSRLLQYLGRREQVTPYITVLEDDRADCILLGTDGVFGNLGQEEIGRILCQKKNGQNIIRDLFERARDGGEDDNQTAIYYSRDPAGRKRKEGSDMISDRSKEWRAGPEPQADKADSANLSLADLHYDDAVVPGNYKRVSSRMSIFRQMLFGRPFNRR